MLNEILFVVYMGVLAMMATKQIAAKSTPWVVAFVSWLVGCGILASVGVFGGDTTCQAVFAGMGVLSAVVAVVKAATATGGLPVLTNLMSYAKTFVKNLLFWPILDAEEVYSLFNK